MTGEIGTDLGLHFGIGFFFPLSVSCSTIKDSKMALLRIQSNQCTYNEDFFCFMNAHS